MKTFEDALQAQREKIGQGYGGTEATLETGVEIIDRIQFSLGDVLWLIMGNDCQLDDYEEWVTQYGVTSSGKWAAVAGGHCSCYGWEEMNDNDITYYDSLSVLLKADKDAGVIITHKDLIMEVNPFVEISE